MKACPFCGREPRIVESEPSLAIVYCWKCGIEIRRYDVNTKVARRKALRKWNRRK